LNNLKRNNMKQTAMQILFDRNQEIIDKLEFTSNPMQVEYRKALVSVNDDIATELLAIEKEQIIDAVDGFPLQNRNLDGEQYYNETYRQD
jgi:hypothetical protein